MLLILALIGRTTRWLYWLHLPVYAVNLVVLAYALVTGELPGYPIAFVLMTTDLEEVMGFFGYGQQLRTALAVLLLIVVVAGLAFAVPNRPIFPLANRRLRWSAITAVALRTNAGGTIRSHDFFYTLADLMGIRWPGARPERSFASPRFVPEMNSKFIAGGQLVSRIRPSTPGEPTVH
jgi:hypothetical protein